MNSGASIGNEIRFRHSDRSHLGLSSETETLLIYFRKSKPHTEGHFMAAHTMTNEEVRDTLHCVSVPYRSRGVGYRAGGLINRSPAFSPH